MWKRARAGLMTAICAVLLVPGVAQAENARLEEAKTLYSELEELRAAQVLEQVLREPGLSRADRAEAHLYLGLARFNLLETEEAESAFRAALRLEPSLELPANSSPKAEALLNDVRAALGSAEETPPWVEGATTTRSGLTTTAYVGSASAVIAAAAGVLFGLKAKSSVEEAAQLTSARDAADMQAEARSSAKAANFLYVGAATLAAGSVVLYLLDAPSDAPAPDER